MSVGALGGRFTGDMGLAVLYSRALNPAELEVLSNVQSQQFALALSSSTVDRYQVVGLSGGSSAAQQLLYSKEIGGILYTGSGAAQSLVSTASNGGLGFTDSTTASFLATNGNSIFFGNNGKDAQFRKVLIDNTENPGVTRFERDWAIDVTGSGGAVDVTFDVASLASQAGQSWNDVVATYNGRSGMSLAGVRILNPDGRFLVHPARMWSPQAARLSLKTLQLARMVCVTVFSLSWTVLPCGRSRQHRVVAARTC